jgi:hypothetical protein
MTAASIEAPTTIDLARLAGVQPGDGPNSPGSTFLESIRNSIEVEDGTPDEDAITSLADDAAHWPSSHAVWLIFTDLRAYREDTTDLTGGTTSVADLTEHARTVLSVIAERLIRDLLAGA